MTVGFHNVKRAVVLRDNWYSHRWYDAYGHGVVKYIQDFATLKSDAATGDATEWMVTVTEAGVGTSTHVVTDVAGGALLITTAANPLDGINMQLGAVAGESISLGIGEFPLYIGAEFCISDVDQTQFFLGCGVTDVDWAGGVSDGIYFRSVDESAVLNLVVEQDNVELETAMATMVDGTYIRAEFLYDGTNLRAYINDNLIATIADTVATFPNDELMRLTVEFLSGAAASTCTMKWLRMIHIYC